MQKSKEMQEWAEDRHRHHWHAKLERLFILPSGQEKLETHLQLKGEVRLEMEVGVGQPGEDISSQRTAGTFLVKREWRLGQTPEVFHCFKRQERWKGRRCGCRSRKWEVTKCSISDDYQKHPFSFRTCGVPPYHGLPYHLSLLHLSW